MPAFFGDKQGLFAASLTFPVSISDGLVEVLASGSDQLGERLTRYYLELWEDPATGTAIQAITRSAFGHGQAMDRFRSFVLANVLEKALAYLPDDRPELRLNLALGQLLGIALARHVIKTPPAETADLDTLVAMIAPTIDHYLGRGSGDTTQLRAAVRHVSARQTRRR